LSPGPQLLASARRSEIPPVPLPFEPVSAFTHLLGALVALVLAVRLLRAGRGPTRQEWALRIFVASVVVQLAVSGLYHSQALETPARLFLQRADHAAIWLAVLGCFLPVRYYLLPGRFGGALQILVVVAAVSGLLIETIFHALIPPWIVVLLYVSFGSIGTPVAIWLVATRGLRYTLPFFLCGISFSCGALIQLVGEPTLLPGVIGFHEIVHVCVLAGFFLHWTFVLQLTAEANARREAGAGPLLAEVDAQPAKVSG
jgi:hemolysin III